MTLPNERAKSILCARALMKEIVQCAEVPERLRNDAKHILRHFPLASQVEHAARVAPKFFEVDKTDPVTVRALDGAGDSDIY